MKRTNKKGFTIVELVVVIAVIAILAAVMIPTFSGVTKDAKEKADLANAQAEYNSYIAADANRLEDDFIIKSDINYYAVIDGKFDADKKATVDLEAQKLIDNTATSFTYVAATGYSNIYVAPAN